MTVSPSPDLLTGTVGDCIVVLTRPEVRGAAEIVSAHNFDTKDGFVWGRPGDFAIAYSPEGKSVEHYPIKREVFLGTYKMLGRVGNHVVAQRLIHVRRAWPITSDDAQFNFGADRGTVPIARGGWLYKSDDNDFGVVHRDIKHAGHLEVGSEGELAKTRWARRHDRWTFALAALPPLLALLALCAFAVTGPAFPHWLAPFLIVVESLLLLGGAATVWTIKYHRWLLKACVETGLDLSRRFQVAAQLLGQPASHEFPGMALWRAAQDDRLAAVAPDAALEAQLKNVIASTLEELGHQMHSSHARERWAEAGTALAFVLILAGNAWLLFVAHTVLVELLAIWLPSLLSAIHSFNFRRRTTERIGAMKEFADQLLFIQKHLFAASVPATDPDGEQRRANLRLLCKVAAQYSQHEFMFALANEPQLPV